MVTPRHSFVFDTYSVYTRKGKKVRNYRFCCVRSVLDSASPAGVSRSASGDVCPTHCASCIRVIQNVYCLPTRIFPYTLGSESKPVYVCYGYTPCYGSRAVVWGNRFGNTRSCFEQSENAIPTRRIWSGVRHSTVRCARRTFCHGSPIRRNETTVVQKRS